MANYSFSASCKITNIHLSVLALHVFSYKSNPEIINYLNAICDIVSIESGCPLGMSFTFNNLLPEVLLHIKNASKFNLLCYD